MVNHSIYDEQGGEDYNGLFPILLLDEVNIIVENFPKGFIDFEIVIRDDWKVFLDIDDEPDMKVKNALRGIVRFHPDFLFYFAGCLRYGSTMNEVIEDRMDRLSDRVSEIPEIVKIVERKIKEAELEYCKRIGEDFIYH